MNFYSFVVAMCLIIAAPVVEASEYHQYRNQRYGFRMNYPSDFTVDAPAFNGDGQIFRKNQRCMIWSSGINNLSEFKLHSLEVELKKEFDQMTSLSRGRRWVELAGYKGDDFLVIKSYVGKGAINELRIRQPRSGIPCEVATAPIIRSFKPGRLDEIR